MNLPNFDNNPIGAVSLEYTYDNKAFEAPADFNDITPTYAHTTTNMQTDEKGENNGTIIYSLTAMDAKVVAPAALTVPFTVKNSAEVGKEYSFTITVADINDYSGGSFGTLDDVTKTVKVTVVDKPEQTALAIDCADSTTWDKELALNTTGGSGDGAVTYAISDNTAGAALNDGKLTFTKAGSVKVTATKAGDSTYKAATAEKTITVNKVNVKVAAKDKSIKVGETVPTLATPAKDTDYTVTGLVGSDELTSISLAYEGTPDNTKAGTYNIIVTATADTDKYELTKTNGTLTIADKTPQTGFEFKNANTATYGKELTLNATGGQSTGKVTYAIKSGDDVAALDNGKLTFKKAGTVEVTATKAGDATYADATATQTITVNKAKLTVAAKSKTITVGGTVPSLATPAKGTDYTVTGLVGSDELTSISLAYEGTPDNTKAGTYNIKVTATADAEKYDLTTTDGKLTIASQSGGGGGIILPPVVAEKPEIKLVEDTMGKYVLSADGTTATITANEGYEIDKVTVNDKETTVTDNKITGLKTGDKVVVTFKAKSAEPAFNVQEYVAGLKLVARSAKTAKGNIKVTVNSVTDKDGNTVDLTQLKDKGYTVKYKFYRSTKKASKYAAKVEKSVDNSSYVNTTGKKGTKYFYKVRVMVYDNNGQPVAKSELKQCKYASRTWSK